MQNTPQFEDLYTAHYPKVFRLCKGYTGGDEALAHDLTQDAFIKVYKHLSSFQGKAAISTWIYRIAVNTCLVYLRDHKKKQTLPLSFDVEEEQTEHAFAKAEKVQSLYRCIDKLANDDKAIILLSLEKTPQKEIADIIGISHEAVRVKMHRIKKQLIKCTQHGRI